MISARSLFPVLSDAYQPIAADSIVFLGHRPSESVYSGLKEKAGAEKIFRLSVFLTHKDRLLFTAPAGPDMNTDPEDLEFCVKAGLPLIRNLGILPKIGIISGGRAGDLGRNDTVDCTIQNAEALEKKLNTEGIPAKHYTILIEEAVKETNFLILPDSLSGEMILKTVAGVGEGVEIGNILLLKPPAGTAVSDNKIYIEQLTKKADSAYAEILKEALAASPQINLR
ncbi:MAG: hypothetical protein LBU81_05630 [Methanosarcinales archaeon]|jgi:predicted methyltransferase MtxX (methanogen marker protein 4)|nr:hypothetical protein [Methanosarcinales archaeon]